MGVCWWEGDVAESGFSSIGPRCRTSAVQFPKCPFSAPTRALWHLFQTPFGSALQKRAQCSGFSSNISDRAENPAFQRDGPV